MKQIFENKIITVGENHFDNKFLFYLPANLSCDFEVDMAELLLPYKNENLDFKKDYKMWNQVFSPKDELKIFEEIVEKTLKENKKIHLENISLIEEVQIIRNLYLDLGYFNESLNRFEIDFKNAPVTIGANISNLIYSFKDYNKLKSSIFFIPPPREPRHQKALKNALNSGVISTIKIGEENKEKGLEFLKQLISEEKINLLKLGRSLYFNYKNIGYGLDKSEIIIEI
ncbi:hypothetical protein M0P65_02625 [Candidatus Gracilibacteria bacterium]|nr:hypothetical protein [Candidatus Gracilibacteria bacterium]